MQYVVAHHVGRLLEARVFALTTAAEASAYLDELAQEIQKIEGQPVLVADHRPVLVYPPEVTDVLVSAFRVNNALLERVAILVSPENALLQLQLARVVREASGPKRKVFHSAEMAMAFVRTDLTPEEIHRANAFLEEELA
ncbi:MAG: hypothetical protein AAGF12_22035, partial [Myxococcota bacterium]